MEYIIISTLLIGFLWGSFLNVLIHRLPKMSISQMVWNGEPLLYLFFPLSYCPKCRKDIKFYNNIPVISYLLLRGKSECCKKHISIFYPLVEVCGALIVCFAFTHYDTITQSLFIVAFFSILLVLSVIDFRKYCLPDVLTISLIWIGLLYNLQFNFDFIKNSIWGAIIGYLALYIIGEFFSSIYKQRAIGGGDLKLFSALGAWIGWELLPLTYFFASVIGILLALTTWWIRNKKRHPNRKKRPLSRYRFQFGPALASAGIILFLWGEQILDFLF